MRIVDTKTMKRIEDVSEKGLDQMIETSGKVVFEHIVNTYGQRGLKKVVFVVGPGNNGADALVCAKYLKSEIKLAHIYAILVGRPKDGLVKKANEVGVELVSEKLVTKDDLFSSADLVVDGVYGSGKKTPIKEEVGAVLKKARLCRSVLAIDLPSGLNADSGKFDELGIVADETIALGFPKYGHLLCDGPKSSGTLYIADVLLDDLVEIKQAELVQKGFIRSLMPKRDNTSDKRDFGKALIVAGSKRYVGAAILSANAAVRSGVGLVELVLPSCIEQNLRGLQPEVVTTFAGSSKEGGFSVNAKDLILESAKHATAVLVGPGIGANLETKEMLIGLLQLLPKKTPLVLDADAINVLADTENWTKYARKNLVLTPHKREFLRLMGLKEGPFERLSAIKKASKKFGVMVVLKGAYTVVDGGSMPTLFFPFANSGLAKAGSGDVLSGVLVGTMAQMPNLNKEAVALGVYLHGYAGQMAKEKHGERGMLPSDITDFLPKAFVEIEHQN